MKDMQMDKTELGCLRAIVLFNPGQFIILAFSPGCVFKQIYCRICVLSGLTFCLFCRLFFPQMQKVFQTLQRSRGWGKRFTPLWSRTPSRNTPTSLAGRWWGRSMPTSNFFCCCWRNPPKTVIKVNFSLFFPLQVCQAAAPPACAAIHRPQVSGASVLLQAHRRHAHRHFPHGDARGSAPDHMTPATPPPPIVHTPAVSAKMKKKRLDSNCKTAYFVLSRTLSLQLNLKKRRCVEVVGTLETEDRGHCRDKF